MADMFKMRDDGLSEWAQAMRLMEREMPKESKRLLGYVGNEARKIIVARARRSGLHLTRGTRIGKNGKAVNYLKRLKRGKVYFNNGQYKVRVYNSAPHAHLLEYGHRIVTQKPDSKVVGFAKGYHIFSRSGTEIEVKFDQIVEKSFEKIEKKLGG